MGSGISLSDEQLTQISKQLQEHYDNERAEMIGHCNDRFENS